MSRLNTLFRKAAFITYKFEGNLINFGGCLPFYALNQLHLQLAKYNPSILSNILDITELSGRCQVTKIVKLSNCVALTSLLYVFWCSRCVHGHLYNHLVSLLDMIPRHLPGTGNYHFIALRHTPLHQMM